MNLLIKFVLPILFIVPMLAVCGIRDISDIEELVRIAFFSRLSGTGLVHDPGAN